MSRVRFEVVTCASPEQVRDALADFSERRLQIWSRTLDPRTYDVRAQGDTWAVARESTAGSPFWVVVRHDWSDPAVVRMTLEDCSWGGGGTGSIRAAPVDGGGSRVQDEGTCTGATRLRDKAGLSLIRRFPLRQLIARGWRNALDRNAESELA